jgi:TPP-dependent pyruvate/acetoin dehydrogenase alpha subunit
MAVKPDWQTLLEIYRRGTLIKQNDEKFRAALRAGKFAATYYSPRGQELIPSAISVSLNDDDYIVTIYRGVHDQIAKGVPLRELWAEYFGKATGSCKGKGGPMHITHPKTGVMVTTGVVGSGIPIANGLALASQIKQDGRVTVCYFGDGASNIGAFHEALNLAAVWQLPVVFVCQNNRYAEHTRYELGTAAENVADRGSAYRMPSCIVDGNDAEAMWDAGRTAVERARSGRGPTLLEAKTFRFFGHVMGDQSEYIPKEEMKAAMALDPVPAFRKMLIAAGHATEASLLEMEAAIDRDIADALTFAMSSPYPDTAETKRDVYGEAAA